MTNTEKILVVLLVATWLYVFYLRGLMFIASLEIARIKKANKSLEQTCDDWRNSYFGLYEEVLPKDTNIQKTFKDFKESVNNFAKETEEAMVDIRKHHAKINQQKFLEAIKTYNESKT